MVDPLNLAASVPPKPHGSQITTRADADGCTLSWNLPSAQPKDYMMAAMTLLPLVFMFYYSWPLFMFAGRGISLFRLLMILAPTLFIMLGSGSYWFAMLRRSRPEIITLGVNTFRHDLGRAGGNDALLESYRFRDMDHRPTLLRIFGDPLVIECRREQLGPVVLDEARRLRYDSGSYRIEVGRHLREPEKEWLATVLQTWQRPTPTLSYGTLPGDA